MGDLVGLEPDDLLTIQTFFWLVSPFMADSIPPIWFSGSLPIPLFRLLGAVIAASRPRLSIPQ